MASSASTSLSLGVLAELELRVGEDDASCGGVLGAVTVERDVDPLDLGEEVGAHELGGLVARDVLVVAALWPSSPA